MDLQGNSGWKNVCQSEQALGKCLMREPRHTSYSFRTAKLDTREVIKLQGWLTGDPQRTWHATGRLLEHHLFTLWRQEWEAWKTRTWEKRRTVNEIKINVDTGPRLSKPVPFYTVFMSSYNQQLPTQAHKSGSSDSGAGLSISWDAARARTEAGRCFPKQRAPIRAAHGCAPHRTERLWPLASLEWRTQNASV